MNRKNGRRRRLTWSPPLASAALTSPSRSCSAETLAGPPPPRRVVALPRDATGITSHFIYRIVVARIASRGWRHAAVAHWSNCSWVCSRGHSHGTHCVSDGPPAGRNGCHPRSDVGRVKGKVSGCQDPLARLVSTARPGSERWAPREHSVLDMSVAGCQRARSHRLCRQASPRWHRPDHSVCASEFATNELAGLVR
jgi:hypothetical protein